MVESYRRLIHGDGMKVKKHDWGGDRRSDVPYEHPHREDELCRRDGRVVVEVRVTPVV